MGKTTMTKPKLCGQPTQRGNPCKRPPEGPDGRCKYHTVDEETGNLVAMKEQLTLKEIRRVKKLAQYLTLSEIADCLEISAKVLSRLRRDDERLRVAIKKGRAEANASVGETLLKAVRGGSVAAAIYWTKAQMGWRERDPVMAVPLGDVKTAEVVEVHVYLPDNGRGDRPGEVEPLRVRRTRGNGGRDKAGRKPAEA